MSLSGYSWELRVPEGADRGQRDACPASGRWYGATDEHSGNCFVKDGALR
jgi:hypothetical protein